jgi:DNA-binding NarL/FixJ family response regulator
VKNALALVVAEPGPLRDSLHVLLKVIPQVEAVLLADDAWAALHVVEQHHPALVLLDAELLDNGGLALLEMTRIERARSRCLVLADNAQQCQQAKAGGADVALVKGFLAIKLIEHIRRLVAD